MSSTGLFGKISRRGADWVIVCEPHINIKIKRLFPEVSQHAGDEIVLSDSPENCRDLLWFIGRFPMSVDGIDYLEKMSAFHVDQQDQIAALLENRRPPDDFALALPPREYQVVAASLLEIKRGLLLADDVGLGKTVSGICPMAREANLPALVVTLTHLPTQWEAEINRFAPQLNVHILRSGKPYDLVPVRKRQKQSSLFGVEEEARLPDVIITNYAKLSGWAQHLAGFVRYVIFDEVQEIRRVESMKYSAARHVASKAQLTIGLSASPIYNYGVEWFNIINVLAPGALGKREEFIREWCGSGPGEGKERLKDPKAFGEYLRREGIMLRRTRKDVGRELPPMSKIVHTIDCDQWVLDKIKGSAVELAKVILAEGQSYRNQKFEASEEFNMILRQATGIAKAPYVVEFVRLLMHTEEKVVIYAWHRAVYDILMEQLADFNPMLYTGSESAQQKEKAKNEFVRGKCRLLLISLRAGAGLDGLQHVCNTAVHAELDWSPGVHLQCDGRVDRDGQPYPVMSYYLVSEDGSDPIIADVLGIKRGQMEPVVNPTDDVLEKLEVGPGNVKRMAAAYLAALGEKFGTTADQVTTQIAGRVVEAEAA